LPTLPSEMSVHPPVPTSSALAPTARQRAQARRRTSGLAAATTNRPPAPIAAAPLRPLPQLQARPQRRVKVLPFVPKNLWTLFQDVSPHLRRPGTRRSL
jgi:hypothetical protein